MRPLRTSILLLLVLTCQAGAQSDKTLIAESNPAIQEQLTRTYNALHTAPGNDPKNKCATFEELEKLKNISKDKAEIVKQLAIFIAVTESEEDMHLFAAGKMLAYLELPPSIPIRVLAPYIDSENRKLRDFARSWFQSHDSHERPPLGSVNYHKYMEYVGARLSRNEEIPAGFIKFIFERHPGQALLVFAYGNRAVDASARLQEIRKAVEARQQGRERTPDEIRQMQDKRQQDQLRLQKRKHRLSEILLAEHTVSNAIWLKENDEYPHRFRAALPEVAAQLEALAKEEWWARLYVVYIMRQHSELRQEKVLQQLKEDRNELVREAAQATK